MPKHVEWEKFKRRFINSLPMYMGMLSGVGFTISLAAMLSGLPVSSFGVAPDRSCVLLRSTHNQHVSTS